MNIKKKIHTILFIYILFYPVILFSKEVNENGSKDSNSIITKKENNNISDAKFVIRKDKKIIFYDIDRFYFPLPIIEIPKSQPILFYNKKILDPNLKPLDHKLRLLKAKQLSVANYYNNLIGIGTSFNNSMAPNFQIKFLWGTKKSKTYYITTYSELFFPDYKKRIYFNQSSRRFMNNISFGPDMSYERKLYKRINEKDLNKELKNIIAEEQALNDLKISGNIEGYSDNMDYKFILGYELFKTNTDVKDKVGEVIENQFKFESKLLYDLKDNIDIKSTFEFDAIKPEIGYIQKKSNTENLINKKIDLRNLYHFESICDYTYKKFIFSAGAGIFIHNDKNTNKHALFSPIFKAKFNLNQYIKPYIKLSGGEIQKNSYSIMMNKNPLWKIAKDGNDIKHLYKTFKGGLGLNSNLPHNISINGNIDFTKYLNFASFKKKEQAFKITYTELSLLNPSIEINLKNNADTISLNMHLDLFKYLDNIKIDYEPKYVLNILATYKIQEKFLIRGSICFSGGAQVSNKVKENGKDKIIETDLNAIVDTDIGLSYTIIDNLLLNLDIENILVRQNEKYEGVLGRNFAIILSIGYRW